MIRLQGTMHNECRCSLCACGQSSVVSLVLLSLKPRVFLLLTISTALTKRLHCCHWWQTGGCVSCSVTVWVGFSWSTHPSIHSCSHMHPEVPGSARANPSSHRTVGSRSIIGLNLDVSHRLLHQKMLTGYTHTGNLKYTIHPTCMFLCSGSILASGFEPSLWCDPAGTSRCFLETRKPSGVQCGHDFAAQTPRGPGQYQPL